MIKEKNVLKDYFKLWFSTDLMLPPFNINPGWGDPNYKIISQDFITVIVLLYELQCKYFWR